MKNEMERRVYVDVTSKEIIFALLEDDKLVEFKRERQNNHCSVEDIFLGKVTRLDDGLNAAFVDIGLSKDAFLPCREIGDTFVAMQAYLEKHFSAKGFKAKKIPSNISLPSKNARIKDLLEVGQYIVVQVEKEEISTKGASVSTNLSLVGRMIVLVPFGANKVSVSKKIRDRYERNNLQSLFQAIKEKDYQIVVRSHARGGQTADGHRELMSLTAAWHQTLANIKRFKPQRIYKTPNMVLSFLRESLDNSYRSIVINDKNLWRKVCDYIQNTYISDKREIVVEHWNGETPIFDKYGITRQIISSFLQTVYCGHDTSLEFYPTEGMRVINVNQHSSDNTHLISEKQAFEANMHVAQDVVNQIRLRDIGGIIAIKFLPMKDHAHHRMLYDHMKKLMNSDQNTHEFVPLKEFAKFTVLEITRQRVRAPMSVETDNFCTYCHGTGENIGPFSSNFIVEQIELALKDLSKRHNIDQLFLYVHPYVSAFLKQKKFFWSRSKLATLKKQYHLSLKVYEDQSFSLFKYFFTDKKGEYQQVFDHSERRAYRDHSTQFIVPCKGKAYLVVDIAGKVCVIDINSGISSSKKNAGNLQLETNMTVIPKIVETIKNIDFDGIIAIDFIDIYRKEDKEKVTQAMQEAFKGDPAVVAPLGDFCVMQIGRKAIGNESKKHTPAPHDEKEICPCCHGTGRAIPSMLLPYEMEARLDDLLKKKYSKRIKLFVHPYLCAFLTRGRKSRHKIWQRKFRIKIEMHPTTHLPLMRYIFRDENNSTIC